VRFYCHTLGRGIWWPAVTHRGAGPTKPRPIPRRGFLSIRQVGSPFPTGLTIAIRRRRNHSALPVPNRSPSARADAMEKRMRALSTIGFLGRRRRGHVLVQPGLRFAREWAVSGRSRPFINPAQALAQEPRTGHRELFRDIARVVRRLAMGTEIGSGVGDPSRAPAWKAPRRTVKVRMGNWAYTGYAAMPTGGSRPPRSRPRFFLRYRGWAHRTSRSPS